MNCVFLLVFNTLKGGQGEEGLGNYVDVVIDKGFYFLCLSLEAKKNASNAFLRFFKLLNTPMVGSIV